MGAIKNNLYIDQGQTFEYTISLKDASGDPMNLTGYTANAQIRKWYTDTTTTAFTIAVNAVAGTIALSLSANATAVFEAGRYLYDAVVTDSTGKKTRVKEGMAIINPGVTR